MADDAYQDRTEQPTPKRRSEAREKGQIARSRDLNTSLVLLTGLILLAAWGPGLGARSRETMQYWLAGLKAGVLTPVQVPALFLKCAGTLAVMLGPVLLGLALASFLANYLQGGWIFSTRHLTPSLDRLQFFSGFKRLFSGNSLVELGKSLAKVSLIALVAYLTLRGKLFSLLPLVRQEPGQLLNFLKTSALEVSWRVVVALAVLGILDYLYQRYRFEKSLRMTKQEVKDEMRQVEGDPRVKARIRSLMRHLSTKRMMAEVPKADVVITNPTHVAVALKYDGATMIAPRVVAKGQGFVALKIMALAQDAGVPMVENRSLARTLYRLVDVGEIIPTTLYRAVAEVLAYIYSLKAAAGGAR